jgi:hypothetical protein
LAEVSGLALVGILRKELTSIVVWRESAESSGGDESDGEERGRERGRGRGRGRGRRVTGFG